MSAKILVVDDEWDFVQFISFNLTAHGFKVMAASNGLDALCKARRFFPDLVVLDLMMEGIDGYSVCEILRRQASTKNSSIIVVTAASGQMARMNALAVGADDFLFKPFSARELIRRVKRVLEQREEKRTREIAHTH
jgi:DNA-binding response OmpR family regulator